MKSTRIPYWTLVMVSLAAVTMGCGVKPAPTTEQPTAPPATSTAEKSEADEIAEALAKLPPEDRALAEKQQKCPVSNELLGTMGAPIKVDVNGQPVFICCAGCKDELTNNSDKYLEKLKTASK